MDCNQWRMMASDYIEGSLPTAAREAMRLHAASCAVCRADEAALTALCRELNVMPSVDPPLFFADNVRSAIERQGRREVSGASWWRTLLYGSSVRGAGTDGRMGASVYEQMGRVAIGTILSGGAVAAVAWTLLLGVSPHHDNNTQANTNSVPINQLLPGPATSEAQKSPSLRIAQITTMTPGNGPAYNLSFWLDNADHGLARWKFVGDPHTYSFVLTGNAPQAVSIPYSAAEGKGSIALNIHWIVDGASHTRFMVLPAASAPSADGAVSNPTSSADAPALRQSFGLPEESLIDAARDIVSRYGVPITLDDVNGDLQVRVNAQDETASDALNRSLQGAGFAVTATPTGLHVGPTSVSAGNAAAASPDAAPSAR